MPGKPDAILFHETHKEGTTIRERLKNVQERFGPILGGDDCTELGPAHGGRVYSRDVGGRWYLSTLSPDDTILFPNDHPRAKEDRYTWEVQPDGTKHGYLKDKAAESPAPAPDTTTTPASMVKAVAPGVKLGK